MSSPLVGAFQRRTAPPELSAFTVGGTCTEWNATTYENVVVSENSTYKNLAVLNPAAMGLGNVLLLKTAAKPIILGLLMRASVDATDTTA